MNRLKGKNISVQLSDVEIRHAWICADHIMTESHKKGLKDRVAANGNSPWNAVLIGVVGEIAFAKALGVYYTSTEGSFKLPDVENFQIRTTNRKYGRLLVKQNDDLDYIYVFVTWNMNTNLCKIVGWLRGHDAAKKQYLDDFGSGGKPVWAVPQKILKPFSDDFYSICQG